MEGVKRARLSKLEVGTIFSAEAEDLPAHGWTVPGQMNDEWEEFQSGRFLRDFLYLGFNEDLAGGLVFDGLMPRAATWAAVDWLRAHSRLPLLLKGVSHLDDARQAQARAQQLVTSQAERVMRANQLERENARLRALLALRPRVEVKTSSAEILYDAPDPFTRKVVIDRGSHHDVVLGAPVIDENGVLGQVTRVYPLTAEVTLVTDKDHAVPVRVERSGVRSVMYGAGTGRLPELRFLSPNAEIQPGDRLVTSGIDGTYPAGLAVAQVTSVERETGQMFARVTCKPLAGVDASLHVLILGTAAAAMPRPEEPVEDAPRKGRRRRG